jgi:hypothetical protein
LELRAERQVAQLNFNEFATSVDVTVGNQVDAGNADLVPEKQRLSPASSVTSFWNAAAFSSVVIISWLYPDPVKYRP